jgi:hypothetical protein
MAYMPGSRVPYVILEQPAHYLFQPQPVPDVTPLLIQGFAR